MSFSQNVDYLMAHPGAVAVLVIHDGGPPTIFRGHASWRKGLGGAIDLLLASGEDTITAVVGEHSILAEDRDGEQVAVVFPTGHPASKVMRRMVRLAAGPRRKFRSKAPNTIEVAAPASEAC